MAYTAEISRSNPTCLVILIDQSGSMSEPFGDGGTASKAVKVADAINRTFKNLVIKCTKAGGVRDYFHIGLIGYGAQVGSAYGGALAGKGLVEISRLARDMIRFDERTEIGTGPDGRAVEKTVRFPVWVEPKAQGRTPLRAALAVTRDVLRKYLARYPDCFPPLVLNLTDGVATEGDPAPVASELCSLASTDGAVLLFNAHISALGRKPATFPADDSGLLDDHSKHLFAMSSILPPDFHRAVAAKGYKPGQGARGFVYNADFTAVDKFLNIGTDPLRNAASKAR